VNPLGGDAILTAAAAWTVVVLAGGKVALVLGQLARTWLAGRFFERASKNGWDTSALAEVLDTTNGHRRPH
jgi:hypothetical protein